jgi:hypothetical protein
MAKNLSREEAIARYLDEAAGFPTSDVARIIEMVCQVYDAGRRLGIYRGSIVPSPQSDGASGRVCLTISTIIGKGRRKGREGA